MKGIEGLLFANFLFFAVFNWFIVVRNSCGRCQGCTSLPCPQCAPPVPLLGGLTGVIAMLLVPNLRLYAWAPLLLDPGTLLLLLVLPALLKGAFDTSSWNLLSEYRARSTEKEVSLRLYRNSILVIEQIRERESLSMTGSWETTYGGFIFRLGEQEAEFVYDGEKLIQKMGFPSCENDSKRTLSALCFEPADK